MKTASRGFSGYRIPFAVLTAGLLLFFLPVVAGGESFFSRDVTPFFYPMKQYLAEAIRSGRFPLWNPLVAGGEPFFASLQPGALYPGSAVLYLFPLPHSIDWLIVLHYVFAAVGWIVLLRHEGRSQVAATFGALALVLGGFFVSLGNFVNNLQTMSWAPWLFLAWSLYLREATRGRLLAFAGVCVMAFFGGEPQLLALLLAVTLARGALRLQPSDIRPVRQAIAFAGAGAVALLVAGIQLVPFLEFIGQSVRMLPLEPSFSASLSQEPTGLVHLLVPPALGAGELGFTTRYIASAKLPWLLSLYPGIVAAGFAGLGLWAVPRRERLFWTLLASLGLVLALGSHTAVYRTAFELLPPLRAFRYPEKFALLFAISLPFLASAGLDRWRNHAEGHDWMAWSFCSLALAYGSLWLLLGSVPELIGALCRGAEAAPLLCANPGAAAQLYALAAGRLTAILALSAVLLLMCRHGALRRGPAAWLLVALVGLDLAGAHRPVNPSVDSSIYTARPWTAEVLGPQFDRRDEYSFRGTPVGAAMGEVVQVRGAAELSNLYLDLQAMGPNSGMRYGFRQQDGLQGVELKSVAMTYDAAIHGWAGDPVRYLRMMNVRFYADATAGADSLPGLMEIARHPELPVRLFELPDPLPRAYIADGWVTAASPGSALHRALQPETPLRRAVLEGEPPPSASATGTPDGRVVAATWEPERVRLIVRTSAPSVLVLLDRWYPGWSVTVNGRPARLLRANGAFRGVEVPAGRSDVEFVYAPASLAIGGGLSILGLVTCLVIWWWPRRPKTEPA